jgi:hypothetical protein
MRDRPRYETGGPIPESATEPDGYDSRPDRPSDDEQARMDWLDSHPEGRPEMVFASDTAVASLTLIEEGCLRGLASLGPTTAADLAEFCAGFARVPTVGAEEMRDALFALDALGWAMPSGGIPLIIGRWLITESGRRALELP